MLEGIVYPYNIFGRYSYTIQMNGIDNTACVRKKDQLHIIKGERSVKQDYHYNK